MWIIFEIVLISTLQKFSQQKSSSWKQQTTELQTLKSDIKMLKFAALFINKNLEDNHGFILRYQDQKSNHKQQNVSSKYKTSNFEFE